MWNETVRPIGFVSTQPSTDWILTNVRQPFGQAFVVTKTMIKEIPLPFYVGELRSNALIVANQLRKRVAAIDPDQRMQVVRHEQQEVQIPSTMVMINSCGIKSTFAVLSSQS